MVDFHAAGCAAFSRGPLAPHRGGEAVYTVSRNVMWPRLQAGWRQRLVAVTQPPLTEGDFFRG
jgi:hypothetical protein